MAGMVCQTVSAGVKLMLDKNPCITYHTTMTEDKVVDPVVDVTASEGEEAVRGKFFENLNRNNKTIKRDRAVAIAEAAQLLYKREIEDMELEIKKLRREKAGLLDLSPTTADSLTLASDFNEKAFVAKCIELGLKIRNLTIKLEVAKQDYEYLFG